MNQRGLYLDLKRMMDDCQSFALEGEHWNDTHVYTVGKVHRMHTVCDTLESLGYLRRRFELEPAGGGPFSRWSFTDAGAELLSDLSREARLERRRS